MAQTSARSARADIYTRITADIVAAIEQGAGEWQMPWHHDGSSIARPRNVASDKAYRGINVLALWVAAHRAGYTGGIWGTYRQWVRRESRMKGVTDGSMSSVQLCRHFPRAAPAAALCEAGMKA
jgi:antirestriction protein ArdC